LVSLPKAIFYDAVSLVRSGVVRNGSLVGPGKLAQEYVHASSKKIEDVMTPNPRTIGEDEPLEAVVDMMERHRIKRIPVTRDGRVVGIVSRANLMHAPQSGCLSG
jgi:CBS domain-containing protein